MLRIIVSSALLCLASLASAQTEKYDYQSSLPASAITGINTALAAAGSKHRVASVATGYSISIKDGEEHISSPAAIVALTCSGDKSPMEVDLIIPAEPETSAGDKIRLTASGYKPMGPARSIAFLGLNKQSVLLTSVAINLFNILNEACTKRHDEAPSFAINLWSKSAPDKYAPGYLDETSVQVTSSFISTNRWNEIVSKK